MIDFKKQLIITKYTKPISVFLFSVLVTLLISGYSNTISADTSLDQKIESSKKITLRQNFFSYSTSYDILIKGQTVGHITGDFYHPFGDTLRITDMHDTTIYSEEQQSRWLSLSINRSGMFRNAKGQSEGSIEENNTFMNHEFQIYDEKGKSIGTSTKDPWHFMSKTYTIKDNNDNEMISGETENYHITKQIVIQKHKSSKNISMKKAMLIMTIEEAIEEKDDE